MEMGCVAGAGRGCGAAEGAHGSADVSRSPSLLSTLVAPVASKLFTAAILLVMT